MSPAPVRFIGNHDYFAEGKFLWEILTQMRNMGVGRYVTRNEWAKKWPDQVSYLKVVKAKPAMDRWLHNGRLWAEWTYRGHNLGVYEFDRDLDRSDWKLIHKHEEKEFIQIKDKMPPIDIPDTFPLPPLYKLLAKRDAEQQGIQWNEELHGRATLDLCIDPQFKMLEKLIRRVKPKKLSGSIYEEIDPNVYLDLYGKLLPTKVEAWSLGPASIAYKMIAARLIDERDKKLEDKYFEEVTNFWDEYRKEHQIEEEC